MNMHFVAVRLGELTKFNYVRPDYNWYTEQDTTSGNDKQTQEENINTKVFSRLLLIYVCY